MQMYCMRKKRKKREREMEERVRGKREGVERGKRKVGEGAEIRMLFC